MVAALFPLRPVHRIRLTSTIAEAARIMYMGSTTALAITDDSQRLLGMITERDVVATVAEGFDPRQVTVGQRLQSPRPPTSGQLADAWFS